MRVLNNKLTGIAVNTPQQSAEFSLIYEQAKECFKAFPEYQFKTVSAILIIIGWLLTATSAQIFIAQHSTVTLPATLFAFCMLMFFKFVWILGHYQQMRRLHERLVGLAKSEGFSSETVEVFKLSAVLPATYLMVNVLLCSAVIVVVWMICQ